jgi:hypothetical protein
MAAIRSAKKAMREQEFSFSKDYATYNLESSSAKNISKAMIINKNSLRHCHIQLMLITV